MDEPVCMHEVSGSRIAFRIDSAISPPRKDTGASFGGDHLVVTVFVERTVSVAWADPETGERGEVYDCQERTWLHLDSGQTDITRAAGVPRLPTTNGPSLVASVLVAQRMVSLVGTSQSHPLDAMSIRGASSQSGIGTNQFVGGIGRDVRHGRSRYAMSFSKWLQRGPLAW